MSAPRRAGWWVAAAGALATVACRSERPAEVAVAIHSPRPPLLSLSTHWLVPGPVVRPRPRQDRFTAAIPAGMLPTPFVDLNGNGRLDVGAEPTGYCQGKPSWICRVEPARLVVHRLQRQKEDSTLLFADAYHPSTLASDPGAELCVTSEKRCTQERQPIPYVGASPRLALKLCDLTGKADAGARYDVELRSGAQVLVAATVSQPPAMNLEGRLQRSEDGFRLSGSSDLTIDRLVVWVAEVSEGQTRRMRWSSEQRPELVVRTGTRFEATVPAASLASCASCQIGVQAVSEQLVGKVSVSSEGALMMKPEDVR